MTGVSHVVRRIQVAASEGAAAGLRRWYSDLLAGDQSATFAEIWQRVDMVPGWLHRVNGAALFSTLISLQGRQIVEIGSYLGRSTTLFSLTAEQFGFEAHIAAIDPHTGDRQQLGALSLEELPTYALFSQHIQAVAHPERIEAMVTSSLQAAECWSKPIDFLYIDGWHSYDAVLADGRAWCPHLRGHGVVVFDDFSLYPEVGAAVERLVAEGVIYFYGCVFGQAYAGRAQSPPEGLKTVLEISGRRLARLFN